MDSDLGTEIIYGLLFSPVFLLGALCVIKEYVECDDAVVHAQSFDEPLSASALHPEQGRRQMLAGKPEGEAVAIVTY